MRKPVTLGLAAALAMSNAAAYATTVTSTFQVQMTIQSQCLAATTNTLNFGTSGVIAANVAATSTLQVQCTNNTTYNIGLDKGANGSSVTARQMKGGPHNELISYSLFQDSGGTTNWGNTVGTDTVAATGTGAAQSFTVYGQVPAQTTPTAGSYSDTITVSVTY